MDKRLKNINLLISGYSVGKFDKRLPISDRLDETDAVINGINMLGEELKAITISRNYFNNIFNSVSDMVFVLNSRGIIEDANCAAAQQLGFASGSLQGMALNELHPSRTSFFYFISTRLRQQATLLMNETYLRKANGVLLPVKLHASPFSDVQKKKLILLSAGDISYQVQAEKMIVRAIIDTQEKERQRLAKDLHDSITQQLTGIKFYISSINGNLKNKFDKVVLQKSNEALTEVITDMRNVCFNLMPRTLEEFGLVRAVKEFCHHLPQYKKTVFSFRYCKRMPVISAALSIDLYRVIQEIISNSLRHGLAKKISIDFSFKNKLFTILLADDGKGFDTSHYPEGMGLKNIESRVRSHNGKFQVASAVGEGTRSKITIPFIT
jgi:PAS domain S-box-containing protein